MTSPFDADDMMRRGIFSSIMGFKRKQPRQTGPTSSGAAVPRVVPPTPTPATERTQNDIFREIVCECEHIERSNTTTPFSEMTSCPTSPLALPPIPQMQPQPMAFHQSPMPMNMHYPQSPMPYEHMVGPYAPPPYSPEVYGIPPMMYHPHPQTMLNTHDGDMQNTVLIEEVVKMVVNAMRQSSLGETLKESPEEILKRKRVQNNEAAARYRKRMRDAKGRSESELDGLAKKNEELKDTVLRMEREINDLKQAVLQAK